MRGASGVISHTKGHRAGRRKVRAVVCPHRPTPLRRRVRRRAEDASIKKATTVRTYSPKPADVQRQWYVIDATDVVLGRLASHVATLLRGKHKPIFANHVDTGDFVIVVNADKIALSGNKLEQKKAYRHRSEEHTSELQSREKLVCRLLLEKKTL